jgi:hypothetical protein
MAGSQLTLTVEAEGLDGTTVMGGPGLPVCVCVGVRVRGCAWVCVYECACARVWVGVYAHVSGFARVSAGGCGRVRVRARAGEQAVERASCVRAHMREAEGGRVRYCAHGAREEAHTRHHCVYKHSNSARAGPGPTGSAARCRVGRPAGRNRRS